MNTKSSLELSYRAIFYLVFLTLIFAKKPYISKLVRHLKEVIFISACIKLFLFIWLQSLLLSLSGNVKINLGSRCYFAEAFSICHWNLNSIAARNYVKLCLLKAYIFVYNFDIICISETYFDSETSSDDDSLEIQGYILIPYDHPSTC